MEKSSEKYQPSPEEIKKAEEIMTKEEQDKSKEREETFKAGYKERRTFANLQEILKTKIDKILIIDEGFDPYVPAKLINVRGSRIILEDAEDKHQFEVKYGEIVSITELEPVVIREWEEREGRKIRKVADKNYWEKKIWERPA